VKLLHEGKEAPSPGRGRGRKRQRRWRSQPVWQKMTLKGDARCAANRMGTGDGVASLSFYRARTRTRLSVVRLIGPAIR
jgi:hypothetical protein